MPYLVDGHNLIPKTGIRLEAADDELELIAALQDFARRERRDVEVYFDGAPPGFAGSRRFGRVTARFVRSSSTADAAIRARLQQLAGAARNWIVVSSDRQVQEAALAARAGHLRSEDFAKLLRRQDPGGSPNTADRARVERELSRQEVEDWLKIFKRRE